jgi:hypothetical protein
MVSQEAVSHAEDLAKIESVGSEKLPLILLVDTLELFFE